MSAADTNLCSHLIADGDEGRRTALILPDGEKVAYADLESLSARYANALVGAGVGAGDRLVALTEKCCGAVALYLAALRVGAVYVPLNTAYTNAELEYFVTDAHPSLVVCDPARLSELEGICSRSGAAVLSLGAGEPGSLDIDARNRSADHPIVPREADDVAAILYTSGTTGRSKGAMLTHGNLLANAVVLREVWAYSEDDVLIHALPLLHTHGLFVGINVSFLSRAAVILLPRFDAAAVAERLPHATVLMGVPTYYNRLLATSGLRELCAGIRLFISGSAPLLAATHREWSERTGHEIVERYGMTETTMLTSNPVDGARRPGTVGMPLPGVTVRIADEDENGIGSIEVSGPNVFRGYWGMPEKTAAEFTTDGYFVTGDLGRIDSEGYLHILGRGKDLVIRGGYNVYPKEVETVIDALDGVKESAVFGVTDSDLGERVIAAVVLDDGAALDRASIFDHMKGRLARYKQPSDVVFLSVLPRNVMGKVQKSVLRNDCITLGDGSDALPNAQLGGARGTLTKEGNS